jgi:hypothetical protein
MYEDVRNVAIIMILHSSNNFNIEYPDMIEISKIKVIDKWLV